jgi:hypothetical protein
MNINGLLGPSLLQKLETGVVSALSAAADFAAAPAGAAQSSPANSATSAVSSAPSGQFAPDLLSALISAQGSPPTVSQLAKGLISALDSNGDGSLSLTEVQKTLAGPSAASALADTAVNNAFSKIDTSGDGQLSADELAAAMNGLRSLFHHHRHHALATGDNSSGSGAAAASASPSPQGGSSSQTA